MLLRGRKGKPLKHTDAEGMVYSDEGLIISFERHPKISLFSFKGKKIKKLPLAKVLKNIKNYQKKNRALEAVVVHPDFGLLTAPEGALKKEDKNFHIIYGLKQRWTFKAQAKITAMELMENKNILILERDFNYLSGHTILLSELNLSQCENSVCLPRILATLKSSKGWNLDNFEGLTHIKDNVYLMISDDNASPFQKCLLTLFEVNR
ncbi:esterase-like activity of phytase family protein [Sulfurimonas sp. MAG313]|nr:esterase-like activity of phytase family protein [Sulfurimonas sp. MAG313]MDF1880223.1 esterase-like activity of phytase family protein [Sulfurimonas sp. MAG313]